ncbi:hypothetical protein SEA_SHELOB_26 [Mycobacterium phage Shelob]|uniref:Uncharacterized protein n=2 Tax=Bixzunavirus TaxID=680114 RepID=A0A411AZ28_9CAUD|nr:hypothetical protein HYRO_22 [Mycobacterium phage HyRo]QAX93332.1 hypothetical protein SEA_STUBBY_22 [Mycobacterium phage Stubby]QAX93786.1 hypothetical protein SEA_SHELOB_26 [Mycobacterium phage Shelob]QAY09853.1 hypothetical protein PBI_FLABSLAB_25 [Mycobacterium phage Flabslab]UEM46283.1 hypothetical protein SEA_PINKCREEK_16 [Mycobacterium phage Pinkcreek]ALA48216.1 hypothetical protein HYRO_22 [Mycobacterium phage HyRo]
MDADDLCRFRRRRTGHHTAWQSRPHWVDPHPHPQTDDNTPQDEIKQPVVPLQ